MNGFSPRIIACNPFADKEDAAAFGVELVSMKTVMSESDFVSVHARLLPQTQGLVGEKEFALMKSTAVFINTARGGLVDEKALVAALEAKKIRGAALDVYSEEPLSEQHPLRNLDNVILTPHMAGGAGDTFTITIDIMAEELHRYFRGEKLNHPTRSAGNQDKVIGRLYRLRVTRCALWRCAGLDNQRTKDV